MSHWKLLDIRIWARSPETGYYYVGVRMGNGEKEEMVSIDFPDDATADHMATVFATLARACKALEADALEAFLEGGCV